MDKIEIMDKIENMDKIEKRKKLKKMDKEDMDKNEKNSTRFQLLLVQKNF